MAPLRTIRLGLAVLLVGALGAGTARGPAAAASDGTTITWSTKQRTLADGRTFFVHVPDCSPTGSSGCLDFLGRPRTVVIFLHGGGGPEDADTASGLLGVLHAVSWDTIFAFGVSKDGTKRWDAGLCCTSEPVDDVGYIERVVNNIDSTWPVDRRRVGATGFSNGAMLALRTVCERPDLVATAAALAGVYDGTCDVGKVRINQWHGALDAWVPLSGGTITIGGVPRNLPPVASLGQRMAGGSKYLLRVLPGTGHGWSWQWFRQSTRWLIANLPN